MELLDQLVRQDLRDRLDPPGLLVHREHRDHRDHRGRKDQKVHRDRRALPVVISSSHPAGLPPFAIVAGGIVRADGSSDGPVYNELKADVGPNGEFLLPSGITRLPPRSSNGL